MAYQIQTISRASEINRGMRAPIRLANWGGDYRPDAGAILCYVRGEGFLLDIWCEEENPKTSYHQADDPVFRDSCLEAFIDFRPERGIGYINFEGNSAGALLASYGVDRFHRRALRDAGIPHPAAHPYRDGGRWGYRLHIPLSLVEAVYGAGDFQPGDVLRGNFYKCGDETPQPHYLSYAPIHTKEPDFHQPDFFAPLCLVDG